jgi:hypothetical protein
MLDLAIKDIAQDLYGAAATEEGIHLLRSSLNATFVPDWFVTLLRENRLAGVCFSLDGIDDESKLGAEVLWLTPEQIVSEAIECQPGASVAFLGYIPIGACAEGSGDTYFLNMREATADPHLVRIPHDFAGRGAYPLDRIELVAQSLSSFVRKAKF